MVYSESNVACMDLKSQNDCQELNNQLAIYRAFRNNTAAAAVIREMANQHCPIRNTIVR